MAVLLMLVLTALVSLALILSALGLIAAPVPVRVLGLGLLVLAVIANIRVATAMRFVTRPMNALIDAAHRIETGDYSAQVPESGPRELRSVARAFNAMSARLKSSDEQRRGFLADVTHELRTPLSVIRGQAEGIADGLYPADAEHIAPILDATHTLDALVDDLRTLALTEAGSLVLNRELVDLATLVDDTVASFEAQAGAAQISLTSAVDEGVPLVEVDVPRMRRVIGNIVANALTHTRAGGSIRVGVRSEIDRVMVTVTDTGEGISPDLLPHVFERFVRGPGSTGSGLGLAIVHDIVTAHGGETEIESRVGEGTTLRLKLPGVPRESRPTA